MAVSRYGAALGLALAVMLAGGAGRAAQDALAEFQAKFQAMEARQARGEIAWGAWIGPDSPFRPYLARSFSDGLKLEEAAGYRRAAAALECDTLAELEILGFRRLYPELAPAFEDPRVIERFDEEVRWRRSTPLMMCVNLDLVRKADADELGKAFDLPLHPSEEFGSSELAGVSGPDHKAAMAFGAIAMITEFAICCDRAPALAALIDIMDDGRLVVFPAAEDYYMRGRAERLGLRAASPATDRVGARLDADRKARLDDAIGSGSVAAIDGPIPGWSFHCARLLAVLPFDARTDP